METTLKLSLKNLDLPYVVICELYLASNLRYILRFIFLRPYISIQQMSYGYLLLLVVNHLYRF